MARLITRRLLLGRALLAGLMRAATGAGQADAAGRAKGAAATAPGAAAAPAAAATEPARRELLVFAAASLSDAVEEVGRAFTAATGVRVAASYAASTCGRRLPTWRAAKPRSASCTEPTRRPRGGCAWSMFSPRTAIRPSRTRWR